MLLKMEGKYPPQNLVHSEGTSNIVLHASYKYNAFIPIGRRNMKNSNIHQYIFEFFIEV
jgi:hypothetical protein